MSIRTKLENNPRWKGGIHYREDGYILIRMGSFPKSYKGTRYKLLHRIIMEEKLGRSLLETEIVHHINGNPSDNSPENLEIMTQKVHAEKHYHLRKINEKGQFI